MPERLADTNQQGTVSVNSICRHGGEWDFGVPSLGTICLAEGLPQKEMVEMRARPTFCGPFNSSSDFTKSPNCCTNGPQAASHDERSKVDRSCGEMASSRLSAGEFATNKISSHRRFTGERRGFSDAMAPMPRPSAVEKRRVARCMRSEGRGATSSTIALRFFFPVRTRAARTANGEVVIKAGSHRSGDTRLRRIAFIEVSARDPRGIDQPGRRAGLGGVRPFDIRFGFAGVSGMARER